jgi:hypothetical protein
MLKVGLASVQSSDPRAAVRSSKCLRWRFQRVKDDVCTNDGAAFALHSFRAPQEPLRTFSAPGSPVSP